MGLCLYIFKFQNPEEFLQGVFVHGKTEGQTWVSGSVNWAKAGRHFKLETCPRHDNENDCFIWKEVDPSHWLYLILLLESKSSALSFSFPSTVCLFSLDLIYIDFFMCFLWYLLLS